VPSISLWLTEHSVTTWVSKLFPERLRRIDGAKSLLAGFFNWRSDMKISARNQLKGKVTGVKPGATTSHVSIDIGGGNTVMASITNEAVADLAIKAGDEVLAIIKASEVMVAK
jgi:molybdopterin-binding protein